MYKSKTTLLVVILAVIALSGFTVFAQDSSDNSDAATTDKLIVRYDGDPLTLNAGSSSKLIFFVTNAYSTDKLVYMKATCDDKDVTTDADNQDGLVISSGKNSKVTIEVTADKYAHQGDYTLTVHFSIVELSDESDPITQDQDFKITLKSSLSSSDQYNRFMGIWDNELPSPFDGAWFAAVVTGLVWLVIGYLVSVIAIPLVMRIIMSKDDPDYSAMKSTLVKMCFVIILLNGIGKAIRVWGLSENIINMVNVLFYICYVIVFAMVIWRFYMLIVNLLVKKLGVRDFIPGGSKSDFESLKPLFMYIGEIILTVGSVGAIMSILGFNMTAIITSAGIISLGITMGAQSVLSQFFSGLVLLATRPFKKGDLITINGSSITYRVRKVNVMNTELENWDNTDISIIPNNTLTSGIIKNITRDTLKTKIHIFIEVSYGTDLAFARGVMLEVANENPRVIKDGSVGRPSTRVTEFEDSNIQLRLSVYVDDFNDSGVIGGELRQALYNKFVEKGVKIDYTQIVVHPADPNAD